jgi:tetratricopeptide (TPR) repeat protein/DNA-binding CsgD family transcriptional regulator
VSVFNSHAGVVNEILALLPSSPRKAYQLASNYLDNHRSELRQQEVTQFLFLEVSALLRVGDISSASVILESLKKRIDPTAHDHSAAEFASLTGYQLLQQMQFAEANKYLQRAYDLFSQLGESREHERAIFSNTVWLSHSYSVLNRIVKALELLMEALEYAKLRGLSYNRAARHGDLGNIYILLEQYEKATEVFEQALELVSDGDEGTRTDLLTSLAICYFHLRQIDSCMDYSSKVLERENTRYNAHATCQILLAYCHIQLNDVQRAEELLTETEKKFSPSGLRKILQDLVHGQLFHKQGRYDEAIVKLETVLKESREQSLVRYEHRAGLELASLYITVGNESKALQCYRDLYSLHYHADLAKQSGEVERILSEEHGNRHFIHIDDDSKEGNSAESQELLLQLTEVSLELNQKRRYLQQILSSLTSLPHLKASVLRKEVESLQTGIKSQLMATVSWDSLDQKLMRLAGPDFQRAVLRKGPNMTPTELRVCALIRCDLSTKEIAQMLGTSIRTIDTHRTRIRKKLGLDGSANLYTFLMDIQ